jgi:hypothetical protein
MVDRKFVSLTQRYYKLRRTLKAKKDKIILIRI